MKHSCLGDIFSHHFLLKIAIFLVQSKENLQLVPLTASPTPPLPALPPTVLYVLTTVKRVKFISCGFYQVDYPSYLGIYMYC